MVNQLVILKFGQGNLQRGFAGITALLGSESKPPQMQITGKLPASPELIALYKRWQLLYVACYDCLGWHLRIDFSEDNADVIQFSKVEFHEICKEFLNQFNAWLKSEDFLDIRERLRTYLNRSDPIRVLVETDDDLLRRFPWHLWSFCKDYPTVEVALCTPEYREVAQTKNPTGKVRILAVLGQGKGIDIHQDIAMLNRLPKAKVECLSQPNRKEIHDELWEQNWDIFFFAGHSLSVADGQTGKFLTGGVNSLAIEDLENALKQAVKQGLQLAIFNSCDGLGIARQLESLHIPQIIVMREPVPDQVAQEFLKYFLKAFASGKSLYLAVREAQERLQGLEDEFPCASWLPVICQNPAIAPPTWTKLRGLDRHQFYTNLIVSIVCTILLMGMRSLGLFQLWELQTYDLLMRSRPIEEIDARLLVVEATEEDINRYGFPLPDGILAGVIEKLEIYQPRVIGLDIFRDRPVEPGYAQLSRQFRQNNRLIGLCSAREGNNPNKPGIAPPAGISEFRMGFSDVVVDPDGILRRHLMFMTPQVGDLCATNHTFSTRVAFKYLAAEKIEPQLVGRQQVRLGKVVFQDLETNLGGYYQLDNRGFQILLNYRENVAKRVRIAEVLEGKLKSDWVKDRIVLIGISAPVSSDYGYTPYSAGKLPYERIPGILVQAQMVSQIVSAVKDGRPLVWVYPKWAEFLWILIWSILGSIVAWRLRGFYLVLVTTALASVLYGLCLSILIQGGWIPLIPSVLALLTTSGMLTFYRKFQK